MTTTPVTTTVNDALTTGGTFYLGTDQDTVGGGFGNTDSFDGQMAEVRIWNDVRTSGEVSSNFNKELAGNEANLVAYWQLNEGSGSSATDKTAGQSNAGTSNVTHTGTYESVGTAFATAGADVDPLPLTNDGTVFSVTGAGTADADGRVTATTSNGGTVIVNQITGEYTYTPALNFYGTDTFTLTAAGDGDTSITDSETVSVTVNRVDQKSVNVHANALKLDGTDDYVLIPDSASLDLTTNWTIEAWVMAESGGTLISKDGGGDTTGAYNIAIYSDGRVAYETNNQGSTVAPAGSLTIGEWQHVAVFFDASATPKVSIYVNGELAGSGSSPSTPSVLSTDLLIGRRGVADDFIKGMVDEVRIWTDVRTDAEIRDNYQKVLTGGEENLEAYYSFDNATASAVSDLAGSHNGTVTGAAVTDSTAPIEGPTVRGTAIDTLDGDAVSSVMTADDLAGNPTYSVPSGPANGTVTIRANGEWTYTPTAGFVGTNTFTLRATDGTRTDDEVITVTVRSDDLGNVHDGVLQLDGTNDYVEMGRGASNELAITGNVTVEAWVNLADFKSQQNIIAQFAGPSENVADNILYGLRIDGNGDLVYFHEYAGAANEVLTFDANLTTGTWAHVAVVRDVSGNTVTAYVNGNAQSYTNDPTSGGSSTLTVGEDNSSSSGIYTKGAIDDLRIWNTARTADQVKDNYDQQLLGSESGLVGYYKFDDDHTGTTAADSVGTASNGTLTNGAEIINTLGQSLDFDGTSTFINAGRGTGNSLAISGDMTMEAWVKLDAISGTQGLVDFALNDTSSETLNGKVLYQFALTSSGDLEYAHEYGSGSNSDSMVINTNLIAEQWYHVAFVRSVSNNRVKVYVDGQLAGSASYGANDPAGGANSTLIIGGTGAGTNLGDNKLNGQMSDLRIWNVARTDEQILDNFNQTLNPSGQTGLVSNWKFNETSGSTANDATGSNNVTVSGTATWVDTAPDIYGVAVTIQENETVSGRFEADSTSYSVSSSPSNGSVIIDATTGNWTYTPTANFNGTDSFTVNASGAGTETVTVTVNSETTNSVNVADGALQFAGGTYDRMTADLGTNTLTNTITLEMKVRFNDVSGQQNLAALYGESTDHVLNPFMSTTFKYFLNDQADSSPQLTLDSGVTAAVDTWYHVAITYDGTTANLYVDGDLKATGTASGLTLASQAQTLVLGGNPLADPRYSQGVNVKGLIDEVRVWSDVRTAAEIRANKDQQLAGSEGNLEAYYRFDDDATGTTVQDITSNNRHGTTANGQVLTLDGSGDYVEVPYNAAFDITNWTVETWFQTTSHGGSSIGRIVSKAEGSGGNHFSLYMQNGKIHFPTNNLSNNTASSTDTYNDGEWHHAAGVYDGSTLKLYIDGQLAASENVTGTPTISGTSKFTMGAFIDGFGHAPQYFNGKLDDVRVWSDARTEAEIQEHMHKTLSGSESNLVAYYTFDDDPGTGKTIQSATGSHNGTGQGGASVTVPNDGTVKTNATAANTNVLSLDGTGDYVSLGTGSGIHTGTSNFTWESWINSSTTSGRMEILAFGNNVGNQGAVLLVQDAKLRFDLAGIAGTNSTTSVADSTWHHVAVTYNQSTDVASLYIDGVAAETHTFTGAALNIASGAANIGVSLDNAASPFNGKIDDVRIWNTLRTANEIADSYQKALTGNQGGALVAHYTFDGDSAGTGQTITDSAGSSNGTGQGDATVTALTASDATVTVTAITSTPVQSNAQIINLPNKALDFDGTNDSVAVPDPGTSFTNMTIETWLHLDTLSTSGVHKQLIANLDWSANGDLHVQWETVSGRKQLKWGEFGNENYFDHDFTGDLNKWQHIAIVRDTDAKELRLYLDGD